MTPSYESDRLAIDRINWSPALHERADELRATAADLDRAAARDEKSWRIEIADVLLYASVGRR